MRARLTVVAAIAALMAPAAAGAFCGFYVGGADAKLFNNATLVVMMRDGTRTVLSMQNNYQGPPEAFAMVVPVPVVLQKENVKTLPREIFDRVDTLAAPRLVEYWEIDPCWKPDPRRYSDDKVAMAPGGIPEPSPESGGGVKIEAQFTVGEYEVVVLSASEANALDKWLRANKYNIPEGAEPLFKPYIAEGWKFFVAKVDVTKVTFKDGQAMLSPLRFHYDSEEFRLPVRLGLINSGGTQDLIVHILARGQRYEVANYKNVFIPTNLDVAEEAKAQFGPFYAALFDATLEKNPGAVVTEYSWDSNTCDPCPGEPLQGEELLSLGGDVLPGVNPDDIRWGGGFVLTRLHARYGKDSLGEDLVFKAAAPVAGGRENWKGSDHSTGANLEHGAESAGMNNFQGRYAVRHAWKGKIECKDPIRWRWGGPPGSDPEYPNPGPPAPAKDLAFAPRGAIELPKVVRQKVPEIGLEPVMVASAAGAGTTGGDTKSDKSARTGATKSKSCGCRAGGAGGAGGAMLVALAAIALLRRRRA